MGLLSKPPISDFPGKINLHYYFQKHNQSKIVLHILLEKRMRSIKDTDF